MSKSRLAIEILHQCEMRDATNPVTLRREKAGVDISTTKLAATDHAEHAEMVTVEHLSC